MNVSIFEQINLVVDNYIKNANFCICVIVNAVKRRMLKQLASRNLYGKNHLSDLKQNLLNITSISFIQLTRNFIEQKNSNRETPPKNIRYEFSKQATESIKLFKTFNKRNAAARLERQLQIKKKRPLITYNNTKDQ